MKEEHTLRAYTKVPTSLSTEKWSVLSPPQHTMEKEIDEINKILVEMYELGFGVGSGTVPLDYAVGKIPELTSRLREACRTATLEALEKITNPNQ